MPAQFAPPHRLDADGHQLPGPGSVVLDDAAVGDAGLEEFPRDIIQFGLIPGRQGDGVGVRREVSRRTFACGMDELGGLEAMREIGAGDTVVANWIFLRKLFCLMKNRDPIFGFNLILRRGATGFSNGSNVRSSCSIYPSTGGSAQR